MMKRFSVVLTVSLLAAACSGGTNVATVDGFSLSLSDIPVESDGFDVPKQAFLAAVNWEIRNRVLLAAAEEEFQITLDAVEVTATAETFRAGIEGVNRGHIEAARSLGMSTPLTLRRIILPQAFHVMSPSIMNQFLVVIKSSTLVSVIAVPDLMYQALRLTAIWFEPIEILSFTAFIYVVIVFTLSWIFKWYTDRLRLRYI